MHIMDIVKPKLIPYILLLIIIALAVLLRYETLKHHMVPKGDEGSFLSLAVNIHSGKGFTNSVIWHYYHKNESLPYYEDTRHPLYPVLIAAVGCITGITMRLAQWLNVVFGILIVILVYLLGKKLHSPQAGLFAAFLTAVSWPMIKYSAHVYSEMLFTLLVLIIALLYTIDVKDKKNSKAIYFMVGLGTGLSYLCRPNGIFIFAAALILALIYNRKCLVWLVSGFFLVSLWWMGRNMLVFGNPLYGHFNYFMWIDTHYELWYTISKSPPGMLSFLQSHSIGDMVGKFFSGGSNLAGELWQFEGLTLPLTKMLMPLFVWFAVKRKYHHAAWYFIFACFLVILIPLIWTASVLWVARYLLVFYPFYFLAAAIGLFEIRWSRIYLGRINVLVPVVVMLVILFQYYPLRFLTSERKGDEKEFLKVREQVAWVQNNTNENAVILTGSLAQSQYATGRFMINYPLMEPLNRVISFSKEHGITDFFVDKKLAERAKPLQKYWEVIDNKIVEMAVPSSLTRRYLSEDFAVYRVE